MATASPPVPSAMEQLALKWAESSADETCYRASPGSPGQKHGGLKDTNVSDPHFTFSGPGSWQSSLSLEPFLSLLPVLLVSEGFSDDPVYRRSPVSPHPSGVTGYVHQQCPTLLTPGTSAPMRT